MEKAKSAKSAIGVIETSGKETTGNVASGPMATAGAFSGRACFDSRGVDRFNGIVMGAHRWHRSGGDTPKMMTEGRDNPESRIG
ncbi:hypothetical protein G3N59_14580 [Paraburkholderia sp. Ac-20340]|uniref:hypothetical protein n=1 Tax=Paraburkholderia sp. Ac-20340 TaxID=2703888 RepID=UPI0019807681|nr:hypothetical protein [Paraburkholderia sp. Ac-20340]MBN3854609.1 hypothetical protein [Paraburkholderia sp. Ac-20340]